METFSEDFGRGVFLLRILYKNRSPCKTENLEVTEEAHYVLVTIPKMRTVALIENHDNLLVPDFLKMLVVIVSRYGTIQFLDCRNDDFGVTAEPFDKLVGIVSIINGSRFECLILRLGLGVKVMPVHHK